MSRFTHRLRDWLLPTRAPDVIIGGSDDPYLLRWHLIPRNRFFNVYLHNFWRSDDDRALHDHPWMNLSWLLVGEYDEVLPGISMVDETDPHFTKRDPAFHLRARRREGDAVLRLPSAAHRVALLKDARGRERQVWTLFITGPRVRRWGFWCPMGWRFWKDFVDSSSGENVVGQGCD